MLTPGPHRIAGGFTVPAAFPKLKPAVVWEKNQQYFGLAQAGLALTMESRLAFNSWTILLTVSQGRKKIHPYELTSLD